MRVLTWFGCAAVLGLMAILLIANRLASANPLTGVSAVTTGASHSCALAASGGVKCWGDNYAGQLGNGTTVDSETPVDVSGLTSGVAAISAGGEHTCALTTSGGVKCWGDNSAGQLGNGTSTGPESCRYYNPCSTAPEDVSQLGSGIAAISAGFNYTCAVTTGGGVKCWGWNNTGELGDGQACGTTCPAPMDVSGLTTGVASVVAGRGAGGGGTHTCALTTSGGVKCWGSNYYGELGNPCGWPFGCSTPVDAVGLTSGVASISAGGYHTCALTTSGGVKCWGWNHYGQLGDGTTSEGSNSIPRDVSGLTSGVAGISGGGAHTCALTATGGVKCWGANDTGQLGNGTTTYSTTPVAVSGLTSGAAAVSAGMGGDLSGAHTCALTTSGGAKCWGADYWGQIGDGTGGDARCSCRTSPADVVIAVKSGETATATPAPIATPTSPPQLRQKVLLITGISVYGNCEIGEAVWMRDFLTNTGWVQLTAGLTDSDFIQYDYTSGDDNWQGCGANDNFAQFTNQDSCWSLDDYYLDGLGIQRSLRGQARRLADFIAGLPDNYRITIVAHSQGGVLATYAVHDFIGLDNRSKIKAIVTLDSPLGGIETLSAPALQTRSGCANLDARYDSAYDMQPGSDVIRRIHTQGSELPSVRLYTVNETGYDDILGVSVEFINDDHSRIRGWESSHLEVYTGNHATIWNGQGNVAGTEAEENYIGCAVAGLTPASACEPFARGVDRVAVSPNEVTFKDVNVTSGTTRLTVLTAWPGSTVTTSLVDPNGRLIEGDRVSSDVSHEANSTSEKYEVVAPEAGVWRIRLFGADVAADGEQVDIGAFVDAPVPATPTAMPPVSLVGDTNCDGSVNSIDAALVLQYAAGLIGSLQCRDGADVNGSGSVDAVDAALILQYAAGLIGSLAS